MKRITPTLLCTGILLLASCVREDYDNTFKGNFDALWTLIDEHYCYFDVKAEQYGLDWDSVYNKYEPQLSLIKTEESLFYLLCDVLSELRDGHVNLYSVYDVGRNWSWSEDYPQNFYAHIQTEYIGYDYRIGGGMIYTILPDNIGYIYYGDFTGSVSETYMNRVLEYLSDCTGIIFDVRSNGGGYITNVESIISHFTDERLLCGYIRHKTGPGHSDFSDYEERWVTPSSGKHWHGPVAVLTNRGCFSAANTFVSDISILPNVRTFGDWTGGGGGIPLSLELPCGWSVRYSSSPMYNIGYQDIEMGVEPDVRIDITEENLIDKRDAILEAACSWIKPFGY